ncbi:MAG: hypothetical protein KDA52_11285, partial [Planctomycetaceae bacterium]|nr:hypothetical protein [Planctomycetaceae bacterium]
FRRRFGIRYDDKVKETIEQGRRWNTSDSSEVFIHGILSKKRTGTCSSLPTFAIAVGRRLGYPLKLVLVPNHTFYRWDDGDEDFNYQHTEAGGDIHPNEYFHEWPVKWKYEDFRMNERTKVWLHSMSPKQETSKFLCNRAILLITTRRYDEALQAVDAARRFNPDNPACSSIREEIEFRQHNPGGLASLPLDVLSQVPLSRPEITLLEKLAPFLPAPGHSPDSQHLRSFMPTLRPLTQPLMPPQTGPQPCVAQPPFPESVSARQLIELTNHLRRLAVRNTQSQSVDIRASSPQPTQPPTMPPQPADLQTFVGTIGLNIEHTRFQ